MSGLWYVRKPKHEKTWIIRVNTRWLTVATQLGNFSAIPIYFPQQKQVAQIIQQSVMIIMFPKRKQDHHVFLF